MKKKSEDKHLIDWKKLYIQEQKSSLSLLKENNDLMDQNEDLLFKSELYFLLNAVLVGVICLIGAIYFLSNDVFRDGKLRTLIVRYKHEVEKAKAYDGNLALALKNTIFFNGYFPASYEFNNIISAGSLYEDEKMLNTSNYGRGVTSLAPGRIFSTTPGGGYGWDGYGTSQSAAVVTGALALLKARFPNKSPKELIEVFKTCHRKPEALKDKSVFGVLDMSKCNIKEEHK